MSQEDFNLRSLADYLQRDAGQLARLAERGQLPGRKVSGQWRFARPEITLWLEKRIVAAGAGDLEQIEDALCEPQRTDSGEPQAVSDLLVMPAISVSLAARTRTSAIESMVQLAAGTGWLWDERRMIEAVKAREQLYPTALDSGVALLHPRRPMAEILERPLIALGRTEGPIPFGHPHGVLTDLFFLLCSTTDRGHLHTLARLSRLLSEPELLVELRRAEEPAAVLAAVRTHEQALHA